MPLLKFKCKNCQNIFEELTFNNQLIKCPECLGETERYYQGKCYFGANSSSSNCSGSCSGCNGCK